MSEAKIDPRVGTTLDGRYELLALVGVGAMGSVYRGLHVALQRPVAVKCMHPHLTVLDEMVKRFTSEARLGAKLNHENIVTVFDYGVAKDSTGSSDLLFIAMEFLAGPSLASTLSYTALGLQQAVEIQVQLLSALSHAHAAGVVHRDISPSNVILEPRVTGETVKLIDFGVARNPGAEFLTEPGRVIGAPNYMAPEQVVGGQATPLSDLYSAGAVLFEMLTGHRPFDGDSLDDVFAARAQTGALDPIAAAPDRVIPTGVAEVCRRATAIEPQKRFSTARAFSRALELAMEDRTSSFPPMPVRRSLFPERTIYPPDLPYAPPPRSEADDGEDFHLLLKLEKQAKAAELAQDSQAAITILLSGVRAASALYSSGQHEIGASAACSFAKRASEHLVQEGRMEEAKSVLGAALELLVRAEPGRAELMMLLSRLEQRDVSQIP